MSDISEPRHDKTNKMSVRPAKTQIRLGGCPGWSEYLLGTQSLCWFCHVTAQVWWFLPCIIPTVLYHVYGNAVLLILCLNFGWDRTDIAVFCRISEVRTGHIRGICVEKSQSSCCSSTLTLSLLGKQCRPWSYCSSQIGSTLFAFPSASFG